MLQHMMFKSTESKSHLKIVRDVEEIGGNVGCASTRDYFVVTADVLRTHAGKALEMVAEAVLKPKFSPWNVEEQRKIVQMELEEMEENAQALVTEMIYEAAFTSSSPLGRPLYMPKRNLEKIDGEQILKFQKEYFVANRMVLAAAGIEHAELVEFAKKYFGSAKSGQSAPVSTPVKYVGGDSRLRGDSPNTHVALGFQTGGWRSESLFPTSVLHMLLGGGSSFIAGGPGKNSSRLNANVLSKHNWVETATAFSSIHNDAGLFGLYGTADAENAGKLVDVLGGELASVAGKAPSDEEVSKAKAQLKAAVILNLDSTPALMEDIGRQVLVYGKREDPAALCARIDAVTPAQVQQAAGSMLTSPVSVAAFGDVSSVPDYETIAKKFRI
jgi:processing peptidase subunit alpha